MATVDASNDVRTFEHWLEDGGADRVFTLALRRERGRWYAVLLDFDVTGTGASPHDAVEDTFGLLGAYLHAHFEDGAAFEDALRPVPRLEQLKMRAEAAVASIVRSISKRIPFSSDGTYQLPPGALSSFVHC
jgi:hypothetical protein